MISWLGKMIFVFLGNVQAQPLLDVHWGTGRQLSCHEPLLGEATTQQFCGCIIHMNSELRWGRGNWLWSQQRPILSAWAPWILKCAILWHPGTKPFLIWFHNENLRQCLRIWEWCPQMGLNVTYIFCCCYDISLFRSPPTQDNRISHHTKTIRHSLRQYCLMSQHGATEHLKCVFPNRDTPWSRKHTLDFKNYALILSVEALIFWTY